MPATTADAFGTDNYASVDGTGSTAMAGGSDAVDASAQSDNAAFVFGDDSTRSPAVPTDAANPGTFDYAVIFGNNDTAHTPAATRRVRAATTAPTSRATISGPLTRKVATTWRTS